MADDANARELKDKVSNYVRVKFKGNFKAAFDHYAVLKKNGKSVDKNELEELLKAAGVGNWSTRSLWVDGVMEKLDKKNKDGTISWEEFNSVLSPLSVPKK